MQYDTRRIQDQEIEPLLNKIFGSWIKFVDVTQDDGEWYMNIETIKGKLTSNARLTSEGKEGDFVSVFWFNFYPLGAGNIRFDGQLSRKVHEFCKPYEGLYNEEEIRNKLIDKYNELLIKYGGAGKNLVSHFVNLD
jgi:hypothetical protein